MGNDLCKYANGCDIYQDALRKMGDPLEVEDATMQIDEVCKDEVRKSQSCYLSFDGAEGLEDTV